MTDVHSRGSRTTESDEALEALKAAPGAEADTAMTDVARHRLDKAGTQRKPERRIGRRSKHSKQQQGRSGAGLEQKLEARSAIWAQAGSALGPCGQNQNRQGKGNPEEHSQLIGHEPKVNKEQGARKSRQTE